MSETEKTSISTPSKITDYFPPSPKPPKQDDKDLLVKDNVKKIDISNSSLLLTPEPSPAKDQDAEKKNKVEKSETDSNSSTEPPKCKQVLLEKYEDSEDKEEKIKEGHKKTAKPESAPVNKKKPSRKKKTTEPSPKNSLLTDFFPVRRSNRKCKSEIEKDKQSEIEEKILNKKEEGLKVVDIENKGRGVVASKEFLRGDFVIEYAGDLIDLKTAKKKEAQYSKDPNIGCYMYYFTHKSVNYCVDATAESGRLGRLINHSRTKNNCHMKLTDINDRPYLMLMASRDIHIGEELLYDYGDRNKEALSSHPWLKS